MDRSRSLRRAAGLRGLGVAFLLVLASLVGLAVAAYEKAFTPVVKVTLETDHVGNQLMSRSDVKLRGVLVGEVRDVDSDGSGARITLALKPGMVEDIPANVEARLLPKTLFGERYVALVTPEQPASRSLSAGDVIGQDRSETAIELEKVLSDLLPLLRTLQPDKLNATLAAVSTALDGRGEQLGQTLVDLDQYVRALNPNLDALLADVRGLADTADVYNAAAPDLVGVLDNLQTTSRTLVDRRQQLAALLSTTTGLADTAETVLAENAERIISVTATSRPVLELLAKYAPEYPCLLAGLADQEPLLEDAFGGGQPGLHITLEVTRDRGKYLPGEEPQYLASTGPNCFGLPGRPQGNFPQVHPPDGSRDSGQGTLGRALPTELVADMGVQGSDAEGRWVAGMVAPTMGVGPDEVPDIAGLLFAPMARGTEVTVT